MAATNVQSFIKKKKTLTYTQLKIMNTQCVSKLNLEHILYWFYESKN